MLKILVTFAVESEFTPWRRIRRFEGSPVDGNPSYRTRIADAEVRVVFTGIGPGHAARQMAVVLADLPDVCIVTGLAGAVKAEHRLGEVLAARAVRGAEGDRFVKSEESLLQLAIGCGAKAVDVFQTSARNVRTAEEKSRLGALADAVEMESFPIMNEMCAARVPAVAIRAIADPVDVDLPLDFDLVLDDSGRVSMVRMVARLVTGMHRLPSFLRFARASRSAAVSLAGFLDRYVEALVSQRNPVEALSPVAVG